MTKEQWTVLGDIDCIRLALSHLKHSKSEHPNFRKAVELLELELKLLEAEKVDLFPVSERSGK